MLLVPVDRFLSKKAQLRHTKEGVFTENTLCSRVDLGMLLDAVV